MNRPLAISCANGIVRLDEIKVERLIEYRMRPHDKNQYPITLGESEYYLLGDNVPLSMDSREWGPMPETSLIGEIDQFSRTIK
jgi:type IV secretory pathway protease TraF